LPPHGFADPIERRAKLGLTNEPIARM